ncbi:MAG: succinate dehydrogenase [Phycisphaerae bacterium]|nr:succinate dehydrogenase [Phycisphaerae bacterium]
MAQINVPLPQLRKLGETSRRDRWWLAPLLTFLGLSAFIVYSTWAALQGEHYFVPGTEYLSPMYSPVLFDSWKIAAPSGHAWFGPWPDWLPKTLLFIPITPAFLILWAPGGFRFTCYYYRGAYYKAFWADPVNCAVGEPGFRGKAYRGEKKLPLIFQNVHRYFFYIAVLFIFLLSYDAIISYWFHDAAGHGHFGIGVGSLVLTLNPILLGCYTFGCHVYRHLVGGRKDEMSKLGPRKKVYDCVSCLNRRHMMWAWFSLFWVGFTDFYVRMVSMGVIHDIRIL